jgi:predicted CoA-substrate-specific enzyme activase
MPETQAETLVGLDAGSVTVSVAEIDGQGRLLRSLSERHAGDAIGLARRLLCEVGAPGPERLAATESSPASLAAGHRVDNLVAAVRAARALHPGLSALLIVGAEKFSLSRFTPEGRYQEGRFNSLCAAGTGSFLDQQAQRLGLEDSAELARLALEAEGERPRIATRCAVFAKTDLIHAQQEGHDLAAICDGLCRGLAANVHDALFAGPPPDGTLVFAGGVAHNRAVTAHLERLLGRPLLVDEHAGLYGALGAALDALRQRTALAPARPEAPRPSPAGGRTFYPPLRLEQSVYPTRWSERSYLFEPRVVADAGPVEVDVYRAPEAGARLQVLLGLDIGSTSTKAVLLQAEPGPERAGAAGDETLPVVAGFYTRTAGRPLVAAQALFEAACDFARASGLGLEVCAAGTTGSGRKFVGALVGADLVLDEITAHAQAAVALDPGVDTILEIGGQDAKFTTLAGGAVTQSFMNQVCAAGTGSFIEEQARRLGCPLGELAGRTEGRRAPLASDRCTVFMERDLNVFLAEGVARDEVLCAVLHAVRENYLLKVAREGQIGERICFQGATAKNRSLVAAFEARLKKPITVSRYCHLTGALGVALELQAVARAPGFESRFRGLELHAARIPVRGEVCALCRNHCKLRVAEVGGQEVTYGFLCGRDADTQRFVSSNRAGFDLMAARRAHFRIEPAESARVERAVTIGLPAALHLVEDLPLWRAFFDALGVRVVTSEGLVDPVGRGKRLARAEFCAPMAAWHAHAASLEGRVDWLFAPIYLEGERHDGRRHQHCYYTQYAPSLLATLGSAWLVERSLRPLFHMGERRFDGLGRLTEALRPALGKGLGRAEVERAWRAAEQAVAERRRSWPEVMARERDRRDDVSVVLLGRPYTLFSPEMNKGIPELFAAHGVAAFESDMLAPIELGEEMTGLLRRVHWRHAKRILAAAEAVAREDGLYPVLVTSFMCAPDACTIEYFRRIMNRHGKPYLILQLDEHDSQVGYETRIEAAVRAFRNHRAGARFSESRRVLPLVPTASRQLSDGQTLWVPAWDTLASPLFVAALQHQGLDARLIREDAATVQASLGHNTGQCIPLNIIVHEFMQSVREHGLDPARVALWMPQSSMACNIGFFPQYAKGLLETCGGGFEHTQIYNGEIIAHEISLGTAVDAYFAYLFGGMLRRMACRVRPYERNPGETDRCVAEGLELARQAVLEERGRLETARELVDRFLAIPVEGEARPKVALFGDLYARDNDVLNQDLVRAIERHGAEALTTPYSEYSRIIAIPYLRKWLRERNYKDFMLATPLLGAVEVLERRFRKEFRRLLGAPRATRRFGSAEQILARFGVRMQHTGESFDNLLKIFHLLERHPDIAMFVQTNPAFCCPSLVTEAMAGEIERVTGVPVVTVTYDGTLGDKNSVLYPYLDLAAAG